MALPRHAGRRCRAGGHPITGDRPDFAAVHGRGPAVRVELGAEAAFGRLLVTVEDPEGTLDALRAS